VPKSLLSRARKQAEREAKNRLSRTDLFICIALWIATFAVYAPVRHFGFVNYDDPDYVTRNSHVRQGLTGESIAWAVTSGDAANWFPVTRLSHILDYQFFGSDSGADHLINVAFHAGAVLLLFLFLKIATGCLWPSTAVAFLFALHPLHVESVAWISERKDTLSAFFWFLTLCLYLRYIERPSALRYSFVLIAFCLDLMSKPMAVTLPLVLLLVDYWPLKRKFLWREKVPFFALAAASGLVTFAVQQHSGAVKNFEYFTLPLRIENALNSYAIYLGQTFWPRRLAVFYPFPADIPVWRPLLAAVLMVGISWSVWKFRSRRYLITGWFWFLITLLPVIGIVQVGTQSHADRYMYLPMTGLLIMLAWGALDAVLRWPKLKPAALLLAGATCAGSAAAASSQLQTWQNSGTLFEHALAVTEDNYVAEHQLGNYLLNVPGQLPSAISHLHKALAINPRSAPAHSDLGIALAKTGQIDEAIQQFHAALHLDPHAEPPRLNLEAAAEECYERGVGHMKLKDAIDAIHDFQTALRLKPDYPEAYNNLGVAYASMPDHLPQAIDAFAAAVRLNPNYVDAQYNLGAALSQIPGRTKEALAHFEIVDRIHPDAAVEDVIRQLRQASR
jgi:Tfp pilus assembly protein PilF